MSLRMGDGPPANLPPGLDAYAGYVNRSGIGITWAAVVKLPAAHHLSITTDGAPAMCADVERGAMSSWSGYQVGYCSVARVNTLVASTGRPPKLWTAHYTGTPHICSPLCWPGLTTTADGTQWTDHGGAWDESLLDDNFFTFPAPVKGLRTMGICVAPTGRVVVEGITTDGHKHVYLGPPAGRTGGSPTAVVQGHWTDCDLSDQLAAEESPGKPVLFSA